MSIIWSVHYERFYCKMQTVSHLSHVESSTGEAAEVDEELLLSWNITEIGVVDLEPPGV